MAAARFSFTLTPEPVALPEQAALAGDLHSLGLGGEVWDILNATLSAGSAASVPLVLRAFEDGNLRGLALIIECRQASRALFDGATASLMDRLGGAQFYWCRVGNLVDASANVGFVTPGTSRELFVREAVDWLCRRYLSGTVVEAGPAVDGPGYVAVPLFDHGLLDMSAIGNVEAWLGAHRNMRRKLAKFRNKGGTAEVTHGPLAAQTTEAILRCLGSLRTWLTTPFQDIYAGMVARAAGLASPNILHIVMRIDGEVTGYHSFAESESTLHALSGAFDRERHSNFHAYENMIIETARYCAEHGKATVEFGPVLNDTKKSMMSGFVQSHGRVYSRLAPYRWTTPTALRFSKLNSARTASFRDIAAQRIARPQSEDD